MHPVNSFLHTVIIIKTTKELKMANREDICMVVVKIFSNLFYTSYSQTSISWYFIYTIASIIEHAS